MQIALYKLLNYPFFNYYQRSLHLRLFMEILSKRYEYSGIKFCTSEAIKKSQTTACVIDAHCT